MPAFTPQPQSITALWLVLILPYHGGQKVESTWGGVDISFTVFCLFVFCVFVRLRISPARIKLAASHFARRFFGILGREYPILRNFAPPEAKIGRIGARQVDVGLGSACVDNRQSRYLLLRCLLLFCCV